MQTSGEPRREFSVAATIIKLPVSFQVKKCCKKRNTVKKLFFPLARMLSLSLSLSKRKNIRGESEA